MRRKDKNRLPPFVPILVSTLDSPAWRAMSHGAKALYVSLKRRVLKGRNTAYVSYRQAEREVGSCRRMIGIWFDELKHYRFIVLAMHGCLGVDGRGKSPHWRLTELGVTSKASAGGIFEPPTNDFLKWDGTPFRSPKKQKLGNHGSPPWPPRVASRGYHGSPPESESGHHGVAIQRAASGDYGVAITSITTTRSQTPPADHLTQQRVTANRWLAVLANGFSVRCGERRRTKAEAEKDAKEWREHIASLKRKPRGQVCVITEEKLNAMLWSCAVTRSTSPAEDAALVAKARVNQ